MENARRKPLDPRRAAAAAALAVLLVACGQSGPLYLPDEQPRTVPEKQEPDEQEEDAGARR
jgi:predicted small lipoprotein YifL